jgi:hypothetical protein
MAEVAVPRELLGGSWRASRDCGCRIPHHAEAGTGSVNDSEGWGVSSSCRGGLGEPGYGAFGDPAGRATSLAPPSCRAEKPCPERAGRGIRPRDRDGSGIWEMSDATDGKGFATLIWEVSALT